MRPNAALLSIVAAHLALAAGFSQIYDAAFNPDTIQQLGLLFGVMIPLYLLALLVWRFLQMIGHYRPQRPIRWLLGDIGAILSDGPRIAGGLAALLAISAFAGSFSFLKELIPTITTFGWDPALARLDRALHLGTDPWRLLEPLLGAPRLITALNVAYHAWFVVMYFVVFLACFARPDEGARSAFLVAFVLTFFIGGNVLAMLFASAGPVYFDRLGLGGDFRALLEMLRIAHEVSPVQALNVHEALWEGYRTGEGVSGISAMPSMHVAVATLLALYGFRYAPWAGWLLTGFAGVIMAGSVMLAWHYAIDGYAGALVAWGCWRLALRMTTPRAAQSSITSDTGRRGAGDGASAG
ncbi:inositol phosphorylceramide synthase [Rhodobacteraceae bacterium WD3A24]|nr:inositol phosphorylceramide synthase [Rhodobacteraceae bacterium WD3A24]